MKIEIERKRIRQEELAGEKRLKFNPKNS